MVPIGVHPSSLGQGDGGAVGLLLCPGPAFHPPPPYVGRGSAARGHVCCVSRKPLQKKHPGSTEVSLLPAYK